MRRSLIHFWKSHLAVAAGAAVASAVLAGALVVGDSVRGSLRDLVLSRLGRVEHAVLAAGFVRQDLAQEIDDELGADSTVVPLIVGRGSGVHAETGARASSVQVLAVEEEFGWLFDRELDLGRRPGRIHPPAILSEALADEMGAAVGDEILLSFERPSEVPRETLVGREEATETVETLRLSVSEILPERGMGGFRLTPQQAAPLNLFVELGRLQRAFFGRAESKRVNAMLVATGGTEQGVVRVQEALAVRAEVEDLGILLRGAAGGSGAWTLGSRGFVLSDALSEAALAYAEETGAAAQPVLAYLANAISIGERSVPYSTVAGIDPPASPSLGRMVLVDGSPAPALEDGEILLNAWAAEELEARPGDSVTLTYYELGARDELSETTVELELRGIVALEDIAIDTHLTPEFPGMHDAEDITAWEPPFPVELDRIRDRDEEYWDLYRAAPKAFVSTATGRRLWASRFGDTTSLRLGAPPDVGPEGFGERLAMELPGAIGTTAGGLAVLHLRRDGLERAEGATDFAGLFAALSMFLIASAALLVGLLFRLGIERRGREVGLLRAIGYGARKVRRIFLAEGILVAGLGSAAGLVAAVAYAGAMLVGLRTWWLPAVGTPILFLHVEPVTLVTGWIAALVVVALTVWLALRKLGRVATPRLLAGAVTEASDTGPGPRSKWTAVLSLAAAIGLLAFGLATDSAASPGVALGVGAALLIAGIAAFASRCGAATGGGGQEERLGGLPAIGMGARNSGRNRGRSILSVGLIASAVFTLVVAGANRREGEVDVEDRGSGAGGFTLVAEADIPIQVDLNDPARRAELGFDEEDGAAVAGSQVLPLRLLPGEDASCLNLYRPEKPRILGITPELVERGGFDFQAVERPGEDEVDNPWTLLDLELGPGVIPAIGDANSVMWILHLGLGKDLVIEDERGREVRLRFVGLLRKSLFGSEVLISERRFLELFPSQTGYGSFLIEAPEDRRDAVAGGFERALAPFGFDATPTAERLAAFQAVENTYIATFQTLGGLGLILGTLGLGIVLLRNVLERRAELATLRAFGYRRRLLAQLVLAENGYLLLAGLAVGTVAGLVAAAPNIYSAAHRFPWSTVLATLALVLAAGMLASLLAVRGTLRTPLLPALKED